MESLYRKYRPLTFESVVGQQHIVSTLEHAITEGRLSHAYLFCGPRGTGKTTMARILAKALLCKEADAARAEGASGCMPDGTCEECELIAEGNHPDVYELDAASRTGVDNVREEIINSVNFAPVRGKYKIYIIDEVHMLTTAAFNALLKTLEEPPEHVVFVLCTTDPQKILETILSRCQRFDFHRIGNEDIERRLAYVCEQEGFDYDAEALEIVARHARGGMRDALSTLEQLSVFGAGSVHVDDARSLLGEASNEVLGEFARKIAQRDVAALFELVRGQVEEGNDLLELTRDLVAHVRDVYMACVAGARPELFEGGAAEAESLAAEAAEFGEHPADRLARVLTVLDDAALEMRNASDARLVLEISCTRLARPESDLTLEALAERLARLEAMVANGAVPAAVAAAGATGAVAAASAVPAAAVPAPASAGATAPSRSSATFHQPAPTAARSAASVPGQMPWDSKPTTAAPLETRTSTQEVARSTASVQASPAARTAAAPAAQPTASSAPSAAPTQAAPAARPVHQPAASPQPAAAPQAASSAPKPQLTNAAKVAAAGAAETPAVEDAGELQRKWEEVVERIKKTQPSRAALLLRARAQADDGSKVTVGFPAGSAFAIKMLGRADTQSVVLPAVCAVFGRRTVEYVMDGGAAAAPRQEEPSLAARVVASADPQPVPTADPAPSSAAAPQPKAEPAPAQAEASRSSASFQQGSAAESPAASSVPAQTSSSSNGATARPLETRTSTHQTEPTPAPKPVPNSAPKPARANEAAKAPWLRSDNPAGAPATGHLPTQPAPRAPERGAAAAPKPAPVQQAPWESEQVPYDDASIGGYVSGGEEDLPPFDVPGAPAAPAPAPAAPATATAPAATSPAASAPTSASSDAPAAPWESNPGAGSPFGHQASAPVIPQTEEEAKDLIRSVFGDATIFKPVE